MKPTKILIMIGLLAFFATPVLGDEVPNFYKETFPEHALADKMKAEQTLVGKDAQLDNKTRQLISLAVAAQIPCHY